jgi:branched-chain amino acid transport system substrate-binding protein
MKHNRSLSTAIILALVALACVFPTPTPSNNTPSNSNSATIDNNTGGSLSVQCTNFGGYPVEGNVDIKANSFTNPQETFQISCITDSDANYLDQLVQSETGQTNQALGAVTLDPSPYNFSLNPIITIPLFRQRPDLANTYQDVYYYAPPQKLQKISQALIDPTGRTASGQIAHFSTFVLVGPSAPTGIATTPSPVITLSPFAPITVTASIPCGDPLGCVIYKPGEPVRIAALLAYGAGGATGSMANMASDGVYSAVSEYNNIYGHPIDITRLDEACDANVAASAAKQISDDGRFIGIVGTTCSSSAESAMKYLSSAGYSMVSPSNTLPSLTQPGSHAAGYFRVSPPDSVESQPMANFVYKQGWSGVAIIYTDAAPYYATMADLFAQAFTSVGGSVISRHQISAQTTDFSPILSAVNSDYVKAIYLSMPADQANNFISQATYNGIYRYMLGPSILRDPVLFYPYGTNPNGINGGTYITDIVPSIFDNAADYGHDAAAILLNAIQNAGKPLPDGTLVIGRQALRDALSGTYGYRGRTGTLSCNSNGDCANPKVVVYWYNYKQGKFVEVYVKYP